MIGVDSVAPTSISCRAMPCNAVQCRSVALIDTAVRAQMTIRSQVEQLVAAVAPANHRSRRRLELETPLAFHRPAFWAFEIDRAGWRDSNPGMAALDTEGLATAVRIGFAPWGELDDVAHADFQLPDDLRPLLGRGFVLAKRFIITP